MKFIFERQEIEDMTFDEMAERVKDFYNKLVDISKEHFFVVESCNNDLSSYLLPNTTNVEDVSYYGKPLWSFRMSDHWNWYANVKRCNTWNYIQCNSIDMPWARRRIDYRATKPLRGYQVCVMAEDGLYHCVYGEIFDRKEKKWYWIETEPESIYKMIGMLGGIL
jgi:hypothetical protein